MSPLNRFQLRPYTPPPRKYVRPSYMLPDFTEVPTNMIAIGCHVFAGGFTMGVRNVFNVPHQLETHNFGRETVESMGIEFINHDSPDSAILAKEELWPDPPEGTVFMFGNPRCTAFSCTTSGHDEGVHGAWAKATKDIHQFMHYGTRHQIPVLCWESVQQAYTTGHELLHYLRRTYCEPHGYRIVHLFLNAATFGNAQHRRRYFFVATRTGHSFDIEPPPMPERHTTVGDVLLQPEWEQYESRIAPSNFSLKSAYHHDCMMRKSDLEQVIILHKLMKHGECLNEFAARVAGPNDDATPLYELHQQLGLLWDTRVSDMPFSLHCMHRLHPDEAMPVISSSAGRFLHPEKWRGLTLREIARLMGWPPGVLPLGPKPIAQIGKGIVPSVGEWLAQQVAAHLLGKGPTENVNRRYIRKTSEWEIMPAADPLEKVIDITEWSPARPQFTTAVEVDE